MPNLEEAREYHLEISQQSNQAVNLLAEVSGLSKAEIKRAMQKGAVWLTDDQGTRRLRRATKVLKSGSKLDFYYNPSVLQSSINKPLLLADNGDYSIWIKPAGVLSQGSKWGDHCSIARWIETNDSRNRPAFQIHRLDRAAAGLMIVGHSKESARFFTDMFARQDITKVYQAIVEGQFEQQSEAVTYDSEIDGRKAVSHTRLLVFDSASNHSLLEVVIETGRKHQIRKHLSQAGFPIIGDRLYGGGGETDLQLTAVSLAFRCPFSDAALHYELPDGYRLDFHPQESLKI